MQLSFGFSYHHSTMLRQKGIGRGISVLVILIGWRKHGVGMSNCYFHLPVCVSSQTLSTRSAFYFCCPGCWSSMYPFTLTCLGFQCVAGEIKARRCTQNFRAFGIEPVAATSYRVQMFSITCWRFHTNSNFLQSQLFQVRGYISLQTKLIKLIRWCR